MGKKRVNNSTVLRKASQSGGCVFKCVGLGILRQCLKDGGQDEGFVGDCRFGGAFFRLLG